MERHRTSAAAFRSFDIKGKGKVRKAQLVEAFDRLRIRLSAKDLDKIWDILDT
jgi:Ca2+-binding EF-hand superfamily protein